MENWALEMARAHVSGEGQAKLFGVLLYTNEHVYFEQMLHDNRLWRSLSRASGPEWIIYSTQVAAGRHELVEPDEGGLGMLKAVWKEPAENQQLLESFEISSTEHLPSLLVFTDSTDGTVLKKAFHLNSDSIESSYASLKLMISEAETALAFLDDERYRTNESIFETVSARLDAWQHVSEGIDVMARLGRNIPVPMKLDVATVQPSTPSTEASVYRYNPTTRLWSIAWHSSPITLADRKGFTFIRYLLLNQGDAVHVFDLEDLIPSSKGDPPADIDLLKQLVNHEWNEGISLSMIREMREHVRQLERQLDQAEDVYEPDSPELLRQRGEIERWKKALTESYFEPKKNPEIDKAVERVRRNIDTALEKLRLVNLSALADHLEASISRGREYAYRPQIDVNWVL